MRKLLFVFMVFLSTTFLMAAQKEKDVWTGIYLNRINNINIIDGYFTANFYIWFRWKGEDIAPYKTFGIVDGHILKKSDPDLKDLKDGEKYACIKVEAKIFKNWDQFTGTLGGAILVDGAMVAYTVAEGLTNDTVVIHFEKGDTQYKGVYQPINQMFLANSAGRFSRVNREQDLGDPGLRKAKLSYHPVEFLQKYRVTVKGNIRI